MEFEWDDSKAEMNIRKHGTTFSEASTIWLDGAALEIPDPDSKPEEDRWIRIGFSRDARVLVVVYLEKVENDRIRLISARKATLTESKRYQRR